MAMDLHAPVSAVDELETMRVYDQADLEQHLAAIDAEGDRLRSAIAAAEARRDELTPSESQSDTARLGALMLEAQAELTAEWEACHRLSAAIEDATEALASRILAEGRALSEALRTIGTEARARRADGAQDDGERWWNDIIDLTQAGQAEGAQIA